MFGCFVIVDFVHFLLLYFCVLYAHFLYIFFFLVCMFMLCSLFLSHALCLIQWRAMQSTSHAVVPALHATNYTYVSKFTTIRMVFSRNVPKRIKFWIFNTTALFSKTSQHFITTKIISRWKAGMEKIKHELPETGTFSFGQRAYSQHQPGMQSKMYLQLFVLWTSKSNVHFHLKCHQKWAFLHPFLFFFCFFFLLIFDKLCLISISISATVSPLFYTLSRTVCTICFFFLSSGIRSVARPMLKVVSKPKNVPLISVCVVIVLTMGWFNVVSSFPLSLRSFARVCH